MGTINNRFQYVWYGTCGEHERKCKSYIFKENPTALLDAVEVISSFTTDSTNNSMIYFKPETEEGELTSMECGGMYAITLRPGKSLSIPGLTAAGNETIKIGENQLAAKVSYTCSDVDNITPSPTEALCIPENYTKITINATEQTVVLGGSSHKFTSFSSGHKVGIDTNYFSETVASTVQVNYPFGSVSFIILNGLEPSSPGGMLYVEAMDSCYGGQYELKSSGWEVNLKLLHGQELTPISVPTPTPVPSSNCNCAPTNYSTVNLSSAQETFDGIQYIFANYQNVEVSIDTNSLLTEGIATFVTLLLPNGNTLGFLNISKKILNNTKIYVKYNNVCYTATGNASNKSSDGSWTLTTVVSKVLSDLCAGEPDPVETPTPTPKQVSSDCCPSSHTQYTTTGKPVPEETHVHTYPGGSQTDLMGYQGFHEGGTLCVDMTLIDGWTENAMESSKYVYLNSKSDSNIIGRMRKQLQNDKHQLYYIHPSGQCYTGTYDADDIILVPQ